ncbi:MAG TPA: glucose PTS transporter subunit IIA [Symbiobacteriaceae bacterium]|jgi:glucose-specific phosphotransferase system IIA component|nr:glucose PTS transporter subunit IIA [Symbiobacteriaceae bacterium]
MRNRQSFFVQLSSALIVPIALLPLAAILLAVGTQVGILPVEAAGKALLQVWLPLFFAFGIAIGFAENDAMAALSAAAGYLVMASVAATVAGDANLNVGVLGGIAAGAVCTWLYNRVKHVQLPDYLALFSGKRLGPMVAAVAGVALGYLFGYTWPPIYRAVVVLGEWLYSAGGAGVFVYGAALRLLIPTGAHHILMQLIDYQVGGWTDPVTGQRAVGEYVRFLAGDPAAGRMLSGFFLTLGFGPLGAALAITHEARPAQRKKVGGLMTTGALTAMLLGVTEPVEFAYIFASPHLFGLHVLFSGLASYICWLLNIHLGGYALPMILINWHRQQNGWLLLPLGLLFTALYYYSFRAVIRWKRPAILGQVAEEEESPAPLARGEAGPAYIEALGGAANILRLEACMTRLRLVVQDPARVNDARLKALGAAGVVRPGAGQVQVVIGAGAGDLASRMRETLGDVAAGKGPAPAAHAPAPAVATLVSPLTGRVVPLELVPDPVFAGRLAGDGVAIEPASDQVVAPVSGRVALVFPGGHAVGFVTDEGLEILLHLGIDTVGLHGRGFGMSVAEGDRVTAGQVIGQFDLTAVAGQGKLLVTPLLVTNMDRCDGLGFPPEGTAVAAGEPLLRVRLRPA